MGWAFRPRNEMKKPAVWPPVALADRRQDRRRSRGWAGFSTLAAFVGTERGCVSITGDPASIDAGFRSKLRVEAGGQ
ncbi:hypothetical protein SBA3_3080012 [Candidatus Sulfopaludibacter sp. SbA3]|nr:hypothetical protein SBA3_3080012 [Candidatus Sulfopaludibacter sp. SbA3]